MIREELDELAEKERKKNAEYKHEVNVCVAASCISSQSDVLKESLEKEVREKKLDECCKVRGVGCMGLCSEGPLVHIPNNDLMYQNAEPKHAPQIIDSLDKEPVKELVCSLDLPFFKRQHKIVLENSGVIDPEDINEYIAQEGYAALLDAITFMTPAGIMETIRRSGLRGRGGGGYPTGLKWITVAKAESDKKYVICNADEGDPGAFMDRSILEGDPHRIIEGMAIAAYAVGADEGFIYCRAEYPLAVARIKRAIKQAEKIGLIGQKIGGTNFTFHINTRLGAGAFVCGEETALIHSIEGKRGTPRPRPPYPAEYGLWGKPTLINNVETFANIAPIIRKGSNWFNEIGTEKSKGTKVFALAGAINNTGLIEVPMGISLREIIFEIGGGIPGNKKFKAVQTGGPSGGCIPESDLDIKVDYDSLKQVDSMMGSGGMIVIDETSSMVDVAKFFIEFSKEESCGKCTPCRVGTTQIYNYLEQFIKDGASAKDLNGLEELCKLVQSTSLCGLGVSAPNPVLSTMKYFKQEYLDCIRSNDKNI